MPVPTTTDAFARFVDDELLRAPLVMEATAKSIFESLQKLPPGVSVSERQAVAAIMLKLGSMRHRVVDAYVQSLREQVQSELAGRKPQAQPAGKAAASLSLVDDQEVDADVVIAHVIEAVRSHAEHELREMLAFTSALAGDMDVTADHNPFRPETQARALLAAAEALPLPRNQQLIFVRYATMPFAQSLRNAYSAACGRLEESGIEPAAYRTVIMPSAGPRQTRAMPGSTLTVDSLAFGYSAPALPARFATPPPAAAPQPGERLNPQLIDSIGRVFSMILSDRRLPQDLHTLVSRLQTLAVQAAALDPELLDHPEHGLWRFMDYSVHLAILDEGPRGEARQALLRFVENLVEQLCAEPRHTSQLYLWALERVEHHATRRLAERITRAGPQIAALARMEARIARDEGVSTPGGMIDLPQLDTVPAELMDAQAATLTGAANDPDRWMRERRPGDWLRLVVGGRWVWSQLLWTGDRNEIWLLGDTASDENWAIRRNALRKLKEAGLAEVMLPRSLVNAAIARIGRRP